MIYYDIFHFHLISLPLILKKTRTLCYPMIFTFSTGSQVVFAWNHHLFPPSPPNFYRPSNEGSSTAIVRATLERNVPKLRSTETVAWIGDFFDEKIGCPPIIRHSHGKSTISRWIKFRVSCEKNNCYVTSPRCKSSEKNTFGNYQQKCVFL